MHSNKGSVDSGDDGDTGSYEVYSFELMIFSYFYPMQRRKGLLSELLMERHLLQTPLLTLPKGAQKSVFGQNRIRGCFACCGRAYGSDPQAEAALLSRIEAKHDVFPTYVYGTSRTGNPVIYKTSLSGLRDFRKLFVLQTDSYIIDLWLQVRKSLGLCRHTRGRLTARWALQRTGTPMADMIMIIK